MLARYVVSSCVCLSIRLSGRLSQAGTVPKRLNVGSRKQRHMPRDSSFRMPKSQRNSNGFTSDGGSKERCGRFIMAIFDQHLAICKKRCKIGHVLHATPSLTCFPVCRSFLNRKTDHQIVWI